MPAIKSYEDLEIWQVSMDLLVDVYSLTERLPQSERFNLISQLNRAVVSIPCNIAEGWGRGRGASQANFLRIARGSLYEAKTLLHAVERVGLDTSGQTPALRIKCDSLGRMLNAYLSQLGATVVQEALGDYDAALE